MQYKPSTMTFFTGADLRHLPERAQNALNRKNEKLFTTLPNRPVNKGK